MIQKVAKFLSMHFSNIKLANTMHILFVIRFTLDLISKYTALTAYWCGVTFSLSKLRIPTIKVIIFLNILLVNL